MNNMQMNGMPGQPGGAVMMQQPQQQPPNGAMGRPDQAGDAGSDHKIRLNTAIYDYFLKIGQYDLARQLKQSSLQIKTNDSNKRKADDDDGKDDPLRPPDLPSPGYPLNTLGFDTAYLLDWFSIFMDLVTKNDKNPMTQQYLQQTQNLNRIQQQTQQHMMRQGMVPNNQAQQMLMRRNMMMGNNAQGVPMTQQQQQHMLQQRRAMMQQANQARGDGSAMDVDGMTPQQIQNFGNANAQRANMGGQGSPNMMNPGMDMQTIQNGGGEFYSGNNMNRNNVNGQNGHALQDYQQQLMLLERQNRKRLEMAKQEQEVGGFQQNGSMPMAFAPGMSPSSSRQGPSPNPNDQMKRGTPQIPKGQIPGSPMPDGGPRASPSAIGFNQMGGNMENGMRGPNGMQPPSSHPQFPNGGPGAMSQQQMQAMRNAQQGGPMPGGPGFPPNQQPPMGPGNQQPQANGQMGTPRQPTAAMPPPQGVPPTQNSTGRVASPAPSATASTPQTTNKPNPKKKDTKKDRKPSTKKTGNTAAAPADNADAPPTSAPATPITPAINNANNDAFNKNKNAGANGTAQPNGAAAPPSQPVVPTGGDMVHGGDSLTGMGDFGTELDFAGMEAGDVLDQFNFDAFIEDGSGNLDNFNFDMGGFDNNGMDAGMTGEA